MERAGNWGRRGVRGKSRDDSSVRYKGGDVWPSSRTRKKASVVQVRWTRGRMTVDEARRTQRFASVLL